MFRRASMKLGLDQAVLKKSGLDQVSMDGEGGDTNALSSLNKNEIESLLKNGAYALLDDAASEAASSSFCEADIDSILADRTTVIKTGGNDDPSAPRESSTFSQAVFASSESDSRLDVNDSQFWEKLLPDEHSAQRLTDKLFSGAAYASPSARAEFMHHLEEHVGEIIKEYQQGNSLEHVPLILDILKAISQSGAANQPKSATASSAAPMEVEGEENAGGDDDENKSESGPVSVSESLASTDMGWTREQVRQCGEWYNELLKPRRSRKVAERYTDVSFNSATSGPSSMPSATQVIESAFKRRLYNKILNGMGGIVFTRKQRKSLTTTLLDLAGVLPFPRSVLAAHTGSASVRADASGTQDGPITTEDKMKVWYTLRRSLESSLQDRRLSELIGWSLSFFSLLISLSDAQDIPIFTAALERLRACVPPQSELDALEAKESKERRKRERHNAIRKLLAEQLRQKIAQAKKEAKELNAAAAEESTIVKTEPIGGVTSTTPQPTPVPNSSSPTPDDDATKLEAATLETAVGTIKVDELLAEEGVGQTFSQSGKRIGRPQTVGLSSDTATLIQMQPHLVRGSSVEQISVDSLQDEYNDAQEQFEASEEQNHYARFHHDALKTTIAHFPSLSEDLPYVKYLAKRCKRWARFMLLAVQLRLELNEFELSLEREEKDRDYIMSVAKQYLPTATTTDDPAELKLDEDETGIIEGTIPTVNEEERQTTLTSMINSNSETKDNANGAPMETDTNDSSTSASAAALSSSSTSAAAPSSAATSLLSSAHRRILTNLTKASISDLKSVPHSILARLLRRTVVRLPPRPEDVLEHGSQLAQLRFPSTLERCPSWWWQPRDDFDYVVGIAKHGVGFGKIAADPRLGFRAKLAEYVFGEEREEESDEEEEKTNTPAKRRSKKETSIKDEDEPSTVTVSAIPSAPVATLPAAATTSLNAPGTGCVCAISRYSRGSGRTKVCTSCNYWYHLNCIEDVSKLKLDQFLPLPPTHPLAVGLGYATNTSDHDVTVKSELLLEPMSRQLSHQSSADDNMDTEMTEAGSSNTRSSGVKDEPQDDSDTQSEGESAPRRKRGSKASVTVSSSSVVPSSSPVPVESGFRCPRCSLTWPVMRALELRMRVLVDHLARVRRQRMKAREKLLRILDEVNYHASLSKESALTQSNSKGGSSSSSNDSTQNSNAVVTWTRKERSEFSRTLHVWGSAFFAVGGYHAGVPVLEALIQSSGGKSLAQAALSNTQLNRKNAMQLQQHYDRLVTQCNYLIEKFRRDTTIAIFRERTSRLASEHRQLAESRRLIDELIERSANRQLKYCFCRGRAVATRLAAAKKARRRAPEESLIGCDDGSSLECQAAGGWYHELCLRITPPSEDDKYVCPFCVAASTGEPVVLPEGADYIPVQPSELPAAKPQPVQLQPIPPTYKPADLPGWETDIIHDGESEESDDDDPMGDDQAPLKLVELETEYNARVEQYLRESRTADEEQAILATVQPTTLNKPPFVDEGLNAPIAYKLISRMRMLCSLRECLAKGEEFVQAQLQSLASQKSNTMIANFQNKMPEWWWPPLHDWALMRTVFKHGIGNADDALHDPLFQSAWKPEPSDQYPALSALMTSTSDAKSSLHKQMEQFLSAFLQDRTPLIKRLGLLAHWILFGSGPNPNPHEEFFPFSSKPPPHPPIDPSTLDPVTRITTQFVCANGKRLESKNEKNTRSSRLPLLKMLSAKLARDESSSSEDEGEEKPPTAATSHVPPSTPSSSSSASKSRSKKKSQGPTETKPPASETKEADDTKRRKSSSKRKSVDGDDTPTGRAPSASRRASGSKPADESESPTNDSGVKPKRKYQRKPKPEASTSSPQPLTEPESAPLNESMELDENDQEHEEDVAASATGDKKSRVSIVHDESEVPRDAQGQVKEFTIRNGIRIVSLGRINGMFAYHKGSTLFPVGFQSIRPYYSVRNPSTRTEYINRILDHGEAGPLFTVTAMDDPDTVYSAPSASACWATIVKAVNTARGKVDARSAVSGLEHFGVSNYIVKRLVNALPGAREMIERHQLPPTSYAAQNRAKSTSHDSAETSLDMEQVAAAAAAAAAQSTPTHQLHSPSIHQQYLHHHSVHSNPSASLPNSLLVPNAGSPSASLSPPSSTPVKAAAAAAVAAASAAAAAAGAGSSSPHGGIIRMTPGTIMPQGRPINPITPQAPYYNPNGHHSMQFQFTPQQQQMHMHMMMEQYRYNLMNPHTPPMAAIAVPATIAAMPVSAATVAQSQPMMAQMPLHTSTPPPPPASTSATPSPTLPTSAHASVPSAANVPTEEPTPMEM